MSFYLTFQIFKGRQIFKVEKLKMYDFLLHAIFALQATFGINLLQNQDLLRFVVTYLILNLFIYCEHLFLELDYMIRIRVAEPCFSLLRAPLQVIVMQQKKMQATSSRAYRLQGHTYMGKRIFDCLKLCIDYVLQKLCTCLHFIILLYYYIRFPENKSKNRT